MTAGTAGSQDVRITTNIDHGPEVRVSDQERLLYGDHAAKIVRRLGDAAKALADVSDLARLDVKSAGSERGETRARERDAVFTALSAKVARHYRIESAAAAAREQDRQTPDQSD